MRTHGEFVRTHGRSRAFFGVACLWVLGLAAFLGSGPSSAAAAAACPNEAVRAQQYSTFLPECRAFELVSPPAKNNSLIFAGAIAPLGGRIVITSGGGLDGGGLNSPTLAVRNPDGHWDTRSLLPPSDQRIYPNYVLTAYNDAFTDFFAESTSSLLGGGAPTATVSFDDHVNQTVHAYFSSKVDSHFPSMIGSDDLAKVYASGVTDPIDPGHVDGTANVYDVAQNPPLLVSRLPDGSVPACGVPLGTLSGFAAPDVAATTAQRWVSADGNRVFFLSQGNGPCDSTNLPKLYRRDLTTDTTTLISGPPLSGPQERTSFLQANPAGSAAFFATSTALTADDLDETGDVYRWDAPDTLTCITCASGIEVSTSNLFFHATVAVSKDLSHAYFRSGDSVYVWHVTPTSGQAGTVDLVASGLPGEIAVTNNPIVGGQLTPDGNVLLFSAGPSGGLQLYRYDDREGSTRCLSCPESGPPTSGVGLPTTRVAGNAYVRVMSDDGSRVFFASGEALVPGDEDPHHAGGLYEWRDDGTARGEYGFIADGSLLDVSPDGSEVLFSSQEVLTPDVQDSARQAYVARIDGGELRSALPEAPCGGEACQGAPATAPPEETATSATFIGPPSPYAKRHHKHKRHHRHSRGSKKRAADHNRRTNR